METDEEARDAVHLDARDVLLLLPLRLLRLSRPIRYPHSLPLPQAAKRSIVRPDDESSSGVRVNGETAVEQGERRSRHSWRDSASVGA